mgnify:CR=1 FL=1
MPWILLIVSVIPIVAATSQQAPTAEQVFKDIQVFTGVPASDLIPAMEFMAASLRVPCTACHNATDYAAPTKGKDDGRKMVLLQRDINEKWFNGRLEVTCMSCHNGKKKPSPTPFPPSVSVSHELAEIEVEPQVLFDKHLAAVGPTPVSITLIGTLTGPNDQTNTIETKPLKVIQTRDGRFRFISSARNFGFDGKQVWYGESILGDEPAAIFSRLGRSWRVSSDFSGLTRPSLDGKETIGAKKTLVVRATRPSSASLEDLYFDSKSNLLVRAVNVRKSTIGQVISSIDYSNYKTVKGVKVPMKVVANMGTGARWTMDFTDARTDSKANDALFRVGGK